MQFDRGYISHHFITDSERLESVIDDPYILIYEKKISTAYDIVPLLEKLVQFGKRDLVIIAEDIDSEALATLILNKQRGTLNVLAVKAPSFGGNRKAILQDIAILTGGAVVSEETGHKLETVTIQDLGRADKIISDKDNTIIAGGKGEKDKIGERIKEMRVEINKSSSEYNLQKLQMRLANIAGSFCFIRIGAANEIEMKERKRRVRKAIEAARAAIVDGYVPGNGISYLNSIKALDRFGISFEYERIGISIIRNVLDAPVRRVAIGAGLIDVDVVNNIHKLSKKQKNINIGYDVLTEKYVDMIDAGKIEPVSDVVYSLDKAVDSAITRLLNQQTRTHSKPS